MLDSLLGGSYRPIARGLAAIGIILTPFFSLLYLSILFFQRFWPTLSTTSSPWSIPLLLGFGVGGLATIAVFRLSRTRVAEWYVYFESYFETLNYPLEGADE